MLMAQRDDAQREHLMRFFKTGPGQYGEGDIFLGLKVPQTRAIVKAAKHRVPEPEIEKLLYSPYHEVRLCGLLLLVEEMKANLPKAKDTPETRLAKDARRERIAAFYLAHARRANNWDLVDLSCEYILGPYIRCSGEEKTDILRRLALSDNLWEQRIAIVTTLDFVRNGIPAPALEISDMLIGHSHDLIHKAVGWVLREVGKKDKRVLVDYLERNYSRMARTTLRYAIEKMDEAERHYWLHR
ncbi:MAG: DNA alkylation repair protein [Muribaculaceae bacterium]|nr:DNA alkylation repair protein [Muribaculaceae bacterium]